jgi:hypothetical protein
MFWFDSNISLMAPTVAAVVAPGMAEPPLRVSAEGRSPTPPCGTAAGTTRRSYE